MPERLVGSLPIGSSHTGIEVSGFPFLSVPFLKESGTRLKNRSHVFLDMQMSGYNLSYILEQVTTPSRVPANGKPIRVSSFWERGTREDSGSRVPRNGKPETDTPPADSRQIINES